MWMEKQFLPGMNWQNYGKEWSVDHIKAISNFDYINMPEANHYTNLQPMWGQENNSKGNKFDPKTFRYKWIDKETGWVGIPKYIEN